MNTVGEHFKKEGNLAAAFFFSSFSPSHERRTKGHFVTTLAYQLILHKVLQAFREELLSSIAKNPAIFKMSLKEQMEALILRPLRLCRPPGDFPTPLGAILVDALDECGNRSPPESAQDMRDSARLSRELDQTEILDVILDASKDPAFPFRVIISSRPEPAIDEFFFTSADNQCNIIFLDIKYKPSADILVFFESHFSRIRRKHHLLASWPGEQVISELVKNASEQMIYAATVIRFIEAPSGSPRTQLERILENRVTPSNPFQPLDDLYARVLNSSVNPKLAFMWFKAYYHLDIEEGPSTWCLNRLCESSDGEVDRLFANMSALVYSLDQDNADSARYIFYHKSFQDFLRTPERYGAFFTFSEEESHQWLVECFLQFFESA